METDCPCCSRGRRRTSHLKKKYYQDFSMFLIPSYGGEYNTGTKNRFLKCVIGFSLCAMLLISIKSERIVAMTKADDNAGKLRYHYFAIFCITRRVTLLINSEK